MAKVWQVWPSGDATCAGELAGAWPPQDGPNHKMAPCAQLRPDIHFIPLFIIPFFHSAAEFQHTHSENEKQVVGGRNVIEREKTVDEGKKSMQSYFLTLRLMFYYYYM